MKGARRSRASVPAVAATGPGASPGTLFVVATPIGNLEDITLRALRTLREVALVAAEDTRRTANLLRHYQIPTPLLSLHEHNERGRTQVILSELRRGRSIAIVCDAGTPGISDPGAVIVREARAAGLRVEPIPGPSAVTAALSAAGIESEGFTFLGFPPATGRARQEWLEKLAADTRSALIFFEAPHRIERLLRELDQILGVRPIIVARELTKRFETWATGEPAKVAAAISNARGEFVVIIPPGSTSSGAAEPPSDELVAAVFGQSTNNGASSRRDAIRRTAEKLGLAPKAVFEALERVKPR